MRRDELSRLRARFLAEGEEGGGVRRWSAWRSAWRPYLSELVRALQAYGGLTLAAVGLGRWLHPGAGLFLAGVGLFSLFILNLFLARREPPQQG